MMRSGENGSSVEEKGNTFQFSASPSLSPPLCGQSRAEEWTGKRDRFLNGKFPKVETQSQSTLLSSSRLSCYQQGMGDICQGWCALLMYSNSECLLIGMSLLLNTGLESILTSRGVSEDWSWRNVVALLASLTMMIVQLFTSCISGTAVAESLEIKRMPKPSPGLCHGFARLNMN